MSDDHDLDYSGEGTLVCRGAEIHVEAKIKGYFQPLNGLYTWYGRIQKNEELDGLLKGARAIAVFTTPEGRAECVVGDPDFWGRYRISGKSTPPYHLPTTLEEVENMVEHHHK
ncbi:DUF4873 domain-containing protein [Gordonia lacunae]|uniref:DUF4873 domain-containing protein n=1 Tax=Gordonia TaxID=2053 RepID=UPI0007E35685|nr:MULTISPECIES: DUF4873 domain-containing protein [unclassified Gordonia (in: high G+C Gram-positive bacteria)]